jgi:3-hydroxyacyl-CoA dehydrogenase/enoyl-CoA hydratase/3-hydroxybutyryl-CoA epimerase
MCPVRFASSDAALIASIRERLLYRQAIEAARCVDEGVITDPTHADVGAILAWGFPVWTGGPLSYIDGIGAAEFVAHARDLAKQHGDRFAPPRHLVELAESGGRYHGSAPLRDAA